MKKEIRKMYLWEMAAIICLSLLWGIAFLIYLISGIRTIATGARQAKEYMANSPYKATGRGV